MKWTNTDFNKLKQRDPDILKKLYEKYSASIYNYLYMRTNKNEDAAGDILCDTFYSALKTIDKIKNIKNIKSWLYRIESRRLYDYCIKNNKDEKYKEKLHFETSTTEDIHNDIHQNDVAILVNMLLDELKPDIYSRVLKLKYIEEKTQKEIAVILNKSEASVDSLLVRARRKIKRELEKYKDFFYEN